MAPWTCRVERAAQVPQVLARRRPNEDKAELVRLLEAGTCLVPAMYKLKAELTPSEAEAELTRKHSLTLLSADSTSLKDSW